jgi:hypothetical protein
MYSVNKSQYKPWLSCSARSKSPLERCLKLNIGANFLHTQDLPDPGPPMTTIIYAPLDFFLGVIPSLVSSVLRFCETCGTAPIALIL